LGEQRAGIDAVVGGVRPGPADIIDAGDAVRVTLQICHPLSPPCSAVPAGPQAKPYRPVGGTGTIFPETA